MKVKILRSFAGPTGVYHANQVVDMPKGADWVKVGFAEKVTGKAAGDVSQYYTGGGWYTLPDGSKVQGEDEAKKALAK